MGVCAPTHKAETVRKERQHPLGSERVTVLISLSWRRQRVRLEPQEASNLPNALLTSPRPESFERLILYVCQGTDEPIRVVYVSCPGNLL